MRILLDTSYFLPLIKVQITEISGKILQKLLKNSKFEIYYCDITLFEMAAKGTKLVLSGEQLKITDLQIGIDALENDPRITRISWSKHPFTLDLAFSLRKIHADYIDYLILATAVCYTDIFATLDDEFYKLILKNPLVIQEILEINDHFQFWFGDLSKNPKGLK
ncbi:MAG: PIN domain-containing protein [Candidatus Helarchaeota archaeon]